VKETTKRVVTIEFTEYGEEHQSGKDFIGEVNVFVHAFGEHNDGKRVRLMGGVVGQSWEGDVHKGIEGLLSIRKWDICRALAGITKQ